MKILQVIPYFNPKRGGDVNICYALSKKLASRGHDVTVLTTDFQFDEKYAASLENVKVVKIRSLFNYGLIVYSPQMANWLNKNIQTFDIIHLHTFRSYQNNLIYKYSRKFSIDYVLQAHGSVLPFFSRKRLKKIYDSIWGNKILTNARKVIALTSSEYDQYLQMDVDKNKIVIVPNGLDCDDIKSLPEKGEFRKKFGITDDEKLVLFLGRINRIKGIDLLVNAFAETVGGTSDIRLAIVGPDDGFLLSIRTQLNELNIANKVLLTGPLYGKDKYSAYIDSDVYVLPSMHEMFPMTVLEACACGIPVIITDRCGIADLIDGRTGLVVPYDKNAIKAAILKILTDTKLSSSFSREGKLLVKNHLIWDKIIDRYENVYMVCDDEGCNTTD